MRRTSFKLLLLRLLFFLVFPSLTFSEEPRYRTFSAEEIQKMSEQMAVIHTKFGDITLKFFPEIAPNHVDSFIGLSKSEVYNGTIFHRVIPGFVIQGGDPFSKGPDRSQYGKGGPGYQLKAEFSTKPHKRGTLSMARSSNPDSAGSQFFICVTDLPSLDGQYTVFGEVVEGMDVVDKIVSQPRDVNNNPVDRIEMIAVFVYGENWASPAQFNMKFKKNYADSGGNIKFLDYSVALTGTFELYVGGESPVLNQDGYYASFFSYDGNMAFYVKDTGSVSTSSIKKAATDTFYLKGTGGFSITENGEVFNGVAYLDGKGTLKKDKSGVVSSVILSGTIGGGSGDERVFNGSFKATLAK